MDTDHDRFSLEHELVSSTPSPLFLDILDDENFSITTFLDRLNYDNRDSISNNHDIGKTTVSYLYSLFPSTTFSLLELNKIYYIYSPSSLLW